MDAANYGWGTPNKGWCADIDGRTAVDAFVHSRHRAVAGSAARGPPSRALNADGEALYSSADPAVEDVFPLSRRVPGPEPGRVLRVWEVAFRQHLSREGDGRGELMVADDPAGLVPQNSAGLEASRNAPQLAFDSASSSYLSSSSCPSSEDDSCSWSGSSEGRGRRRGVGHTAGSSAFSSSCSDSFSSGDLCPPEIVGDVPLSLRSLRRSAPSGLRECGAADFSRLPSSPLAPSNSLSYVSHVAKGLRGNDAALASLGQPHARRRGEGALGYKNRYQVSPRIPLPVANAATPLIRAPPSGLSTAEEEEEEDEEDDDAGDSYYFEDMAPAIALPACGDGTSVCGGNPSGAPLATDVNKARPSAKEPPTIAQRSTRDLQRDSVRLVATTKVAPALQSALGGAIPLSPRSSHGKRKGRGAPLTGKGKGERCGVDRGGSTAPVATPRRLGKAATQGEGVGLPALLSPRPPPVLAALLSAADGASNAADAAPVRTVDECSVSAETHTPVRTVDKAIDSPLARSRERGKRRPGVGQLSASRVVPQSATAEVAVEITEAEREHIAALVQMPPIAQSKARVAAPSAVLYTSTCGAASMGNAVFDSSDGGGGCTFYNPFHLAVYGGVGAAPRQPSRGEAEGYLRGEEDVRRAGLSTFSSSASSSSADSEASPATKAVIAPTHSRVPIDKCAIALKDVSNAACGREGREETPFPCGSLVSSTAGDAPSGVVRHPPSLRLPETHEAVVAALLRTAAEMAATGGAASSSSAAGSTCMNVNSIEAGLSVRGDWYTEALSPSVAALLLSHSIALSGGGGAEPAGEQRGSVVRSHGLFATSTRSVITHITATRSAKTKGKEFAHPSMTHSNPNPIIRPHPAVAALLAVPYEAQGSAAMGSMDNLQRRAAVKRDPSVQAALGRFWRAMPKVHDGVSSAMATTAVDGVSHHSWQQQQQQQPFVNFHAYRWAALKLFTVLVVQPAVGEAPPSSPPQNTAGAAGSGGGPTSAQRGARGSVFSPMHAGFGGGQQQRGLRGRAFDPAAAAEERRGRYMAKFDTIVARRDWVAAWTGANYERLLTALERIAADAEAAIQRHSANPSAGSTSTLALRLPPLPRVNTNRFLMDRWQFEHYLFLVADVWCETAEAAEYAAFISACYVAVFMDGKEAAAAAAATNSSPSPGLSPAAVEGAAISDADGPLQPSEASPVGLRGFVGPNTLYDRRLVLEIFRDAPATKRGAGGGGKQKTKGRRRGLAADDPTNFIPPAHLYRQQQQQQVLQSGGSSVQQHQLLPPPTLAVAVPGLAAAPPQRPSPPPLRREDVLAAFWVQQQDERDRLRAGRLAARAQRAAAREAAAIAAAEEAATAAKKAKADALAAIISNPSAMAFTTPRTPALRSPQPQSLTAAPEQLTQAAGTLMPHSARRQRPIVAMPPQQLTATERVREAMFGRRETAAERKEKRKGRREAREQRRAARVEEAEGVEGANSRSLTPRTAGARSRALSMASAASGGRRPSRQEEAADLSLFGDLPALNASISQRSLSLSHAGGGGGVGAPFASALAPTGIGRPLRVGGRFGGARGGSLVGQEGASGGGGAEDAALVAKRRERERKELMRGILGARAEKAKALQRDMAAAKAAVERAERERLGIGIGGDAEDPTSPQYDGGGAWLLDSAAVLPHFTDSGEGDAEEAEEEEEELRRREFEELIVSAERRTREDNSAARRGFAEALAEAERRGAADEVARIKARARRRLRRRAAEGGMAGGGDSDNNMRGLLGADGEDGDNDDWGDIDAEFYDSSDGDGGGGGTSDDASERRRGSAASGGGGRAIDRVPSPSTAALSPNHPHIDDASATVEASVAGDDGVSPGQEDPSADAAADGGSVPQRPRRRRYHYYTFNGVSVVGGGFGGGFGGSGSRDPFGGAGGSDGNRRRRDSSPPDALDSERIAAQNKLRRERHAAAVRAKREEERRVKELARAEKEEAARREARRQLEEALEVERARKHQQQLDGYSRSQRQYYADQWRRGGSSSSASSASVASGRRRRKAAAASQRRAATDEAMRGRLAAVAGGGDVVPLAAAATVGSDHLVGGGGGSAFAAVIPMDPISDLISGAPLASALPSMHHAATDCGGGGRVDANAMGAPPIPARPSTASYRGRGGAEERTPTSTSAPSSSAHKVRGHDAAESSSGTASAPDSITEESAASPMSAGQPVDASRTPPLFAKALTSPSNRGSRVEDAEEAADGALNNRVSSQTAAALLPNESPQIFDQLPSLTVVATSADAFIGGGPASRVLCRSDHDEEEEVEGEGGIGDEKGHRSLLDRVLMSTPEPAAATAPPTPEDEPLAPTPLPLPSDAAPLSSCLVTASHPLLRQSLPPVLAALAERILGDTVAPPVLAGAELSPPARAADTDGDSEAESGDDCSTAAGIGVVKAAVWRAWLEAYAADAVIAAAIASPSSLPHSCPVPRPVAVLLVDTPDPCHRCQEEVGVDDDEGMGGAAVVSTCSDRGNARRVVQPRRWVVSPAALLRLWDAEASLVAGSDVSFASACARRGVWLWRGLRAAAAEEVGEAAPGVDDGFPPPSLSQRLAERQHSAIARHSVCAAVSAASPPHHYPPAAAADTNAILLSSPHAHSFLSGAEADENGVIHWRPTATVGGGGSSSMVDTAFLGQLFGARGTLRYLAVRLSLRDDAEGSTDDDPMLPTLRALAWALTLWAEGLLAVEGTAAVSAASTAVSSGGSKRAAKSDDSDAVQGAPAASASSRLASREEAARARLNGFFLSQCVFSNVNTIEITVADELLAGSGGPNGASAVVAASPRRRLLIRAICTAVAVIATRQPTIAAVRIDPLLAAIADGGHGEGGDIAASSSHSANSFSPAPFDTIGLLVDAEGSDGGAATAVQALDLSSSSAPSAALMCGPLIAGGVGGCEGNIAAMAVLGGRRAWAQSVLNVVVDPLRMGLSPRRSSLVGVGVGGGGTGGDPMASSSASFAAMAASPSAAFTSPSASSLHAHASFLAPYTPSPAVPDAPRAFELFWCWAVYCQRQREAFLQNLPARLRTVFGLHQPEGDGTLMPSPPPTPSAVAAGGRGGASLGRPPSSPRRRDGRGAARASDSPLTTAAIPSANILSQLMRRAVSHCVDPVASRAAGEGADDSHSMPPSVLPTPTVTNLSPPRPALGHVAENEEGDGAEEGRVAIAATRQYLRYLSLLFPPPSVPDPSSVQPDEGSPEASALPPLNFPSLADFLAKEAGVLTPSSSLSSSAPQQKHQQQQHQQQWFTPVSAALLLRAAMSPSIDSAATRHLPDALLRSASAAVGGGVGVPPPPPLTVATAKGARMAIVLMLGALPPPAGGGGGPQQPQRDFWLVPPLSKTVARAAEAADSTTASHHHRDAYHPALLAAVAERLGPLARGIAALSDCSVSACASTSFSAFLSSLLTAAMGVPASLSNGAPFSSTSSAEASLSPAFGSAVSAAAVGSLIALLCGRVLSQGHSNPLAHSTNNGSAASLKFPHSAWLEGTRQHAAESAEVALLAGNPYAVRQKYSMSGGGGPRGDRVASLSECLAAPFLVPLLDATLGTVARGGAPFVGGAVSCGALVAKGPTPSAPSAPLSSVSTPLNSAADGALAVPSAESSRPQSASSNGGGGVLSPTKPLGSAARSGRPLGRPAAKEAKAVSSDAFASSTAILPTASSSASAAMVASSGATPQQPPPSPSHATGGGVSAVAAGTRIAFVPPLTLHGAAALLHLSATTPNTPPAVSSQKAPMPSLGDLSDFVYDLPSSSFSSRPLVGAADSNALRLTLPALAAGMGIDADGASAYLAVANASQHSQRGVPSSVAASGGSLSTADVRRLRGLARRFAAWATVPAPSTAAAAEEGDIRIGSRPSSGRSEVRGDGSGAPYMTASQFLSFMGI